LRTIAYYSHDKVWAKLYDESVDAYMYLAKLAHPDFSDKELKFIRPDFKKLVLAILTI
jgi:hypothetical protein